MGCAAYGKARGQVAWRWTTDGLTAEIGLSRSAFAGRFTKAVGEPPMRYLARRRLACVAQRQRRQCRL